MALLTLTCRIIYDRLIATMRTNILGSIIAIVLLGGTLGGYYYLTADYPQSKDPVSFPKPPAQIAQPSQPVSQTTAVPAPAPVAKPAPVPNASYTPLPYTPDPLPYPDAANYTPSYTSTYTPWSYQAKPPTTQWQTKPTNNCIGASAVGC